MKFVDLPEIESPVDIELAPPWRAAVGAKNWGKRAKLVDEALLDTLTLGLADSEPARLAIAYATLQLTALCEQEGDLNIQSVDAAVCYFHSSHPAWRAAARRWFEINKIDVDDIFDRRTGLRLLHDALLMQRVVRSSSTSGLSAMYRRYERALAQAASQGFHGLEAAAYAVRHQ